MITALSADVGLCGRRRKTALWFVALVALILALVAKVPVDDRIRKPENMTDSNALLMRCG
jgi:hypothetical protein